VSIRIQNDGVAGTGASQINPTDRLSIGSGRGTSSTGGPTDSVEISSLSENLSSTMSSLESQHADKVSRLAALYAQGQYQIDPAAISRSLVSSAITTGELEG